MVDRRQAVDGGTAERESPASRGLTEDEWVAEIRKILGDEAPGVRLGVGDDAALVQIGDREAILTTDLLVEGVHFRLDTISPRDLGYKAVVVNVSLNLAFIPILYVVVKSIGRRRHGQPAS